MSFLSTLVRIGRNFGRLLNTGRWAYAISSPEVYSDIDSDKAVKQGYNANTAVYSIVTKDAKKFASVPWYVYDKGRAEQKQYRQWPRWVQEHKQAREKIEGNKLADLLARPNPNEGQDAFFAKVRAYYKICGEAFIWLNRGPLDDYRLPDGSLDDMAIDRLPVLQMQVLPSNMMTIIPDPNDPWGVLGYVLECGERVVMRAGDVIHWKNTTLEFDITTREHLRGMSPLKAGALTLDENRAMAKAAKRQADNNGAAGVLIDETLGKPTPEQQSQIKRVIDAKINNNDTSNAVAALQGKWSYLDIARSAKDMMLIEGQVFSWQELCFLFGMPVEFFDRNTTFDNKKQAQVQWVLNEIMPDAKQLRDEINRVLLKAFNLDGRAFIDADFAGMLEIQEALVIVAKQMQDLWCISPDEVREVLNYERLGGDFDEPWVPNGRTPMSKANLDDGGEDIIRELDAQRNRDTGNRDE